MKLLIALAFLVASSTHAAFAPVNGLQLYYEIHGDGPPLVLIHGGGSTIESNWSRLLPLLAKKFKVIAMEEQGHGHTAAVARPFTFENSADDVAALLDHLKIEKAAIFGFSNGGSIAMRVATRHPTKVTRLVVASAMYRRDGMVKGFWEGMKKGTLADMPKALQEADRKVNPDPKHLAALFKQDSQRMLGFKDWPEKDLRAIAVPTLILIGDRDIITPEHAIRMRGLIPKGRLAIVPANHGSFVGEVASTENPDSPLPEATALLVEAFLAGPE